jgi:hypothetical protein
MLHRSLGVNLVHLWVSIDSVFGVASFLKASLRDRAWACGSASPLVQEGSLGWRWFRGGGYSLLFGCGLAVVIPVVSRYL